MKHALIITGSLTVRMDLDAAFRDAGWTTVLCATATAARDALRQANFGAAVLDVLLPDADGIDLLRELKGDPATGGVPVILLSSLAEVADRVRRLPAGADDYMEKPYDRADLVSRAQRLADRGQTPSADRSTPLILAVDDSPTYRHELATLLEQAGYAVILAESGGQALNILRDRAPDCILMDMLMPGMTGQQACRRIKESPQWHSIPVIMLTGREDRDALIESFEAGADDYVSKSSDFQILRARLQAQLRHRQAERQAERTLAELHRKEVEVAEVRATEEATKASLAEKEVLLKEIHHRVKNNMQVLSSLVSLQADTLHDPALAAAFADVRDRVRSMALVHEKLYQSDNMAALDFAAYAESLLQYLWRAHAPKVAVDLKLALEPVSLTVESAVPCGLILNELAANALKHAFRGRSGGVVTVATRAEPDGRVNLRVSDNGVGLPAGFDWQQTKSLGLRLVQMLVRQLGGTVDARTSAAGTEFEVVFPGGKR